MEGFLLPCSILRGCAGWLQERHIDWKGINLPESIQSRIFEVKSEFSRLLKMEAESRSWEIQHWDSSFKDLPAAIRLKMNRLRYTHKKSHWTINTWNGHQSKNKDVSSNKNLVENPAFIDHSPRLSYGVFASLCWPRGPSRRCLEIGLTRQQALQPEVRWCDDGMIGWWWSYDGILQSIWLAINNYCCS